MKHFVKTLKTNEAAAILNVSTNTIRSWERRYGFPKTTRTPGNHRIYKHAEIIALRDAIRSGLSVASAISQVRAMIGSDTESLYATLSDFNETRADRVMETVLALRPIDRTIEEVLLPTLDRIYQQKGAHSVSWAFAATWAEDWLRRAKRVAYQPTEEAIVLIGDATNGQLDPDFIAMRVLELFCARAGVETFTVPTGSTNGIGDVMRRFNPKAVIVTGTAMQARQTIAWGQLIQQQQTRRNAGGWMPAMFYRTSLTPDLTDSVLVLNATPLTAHRQLLELTEKPKQIAAVSLAANITDPMDELLDPLQQPYQDLAI